MRPQGQVPPTSRTVFSLASLRRRVAIELVRWLTHGTTAALLPIGDHGTPTALRSTECSR